MSSLVNRPESSAQGGPIEFNFEGLKMRDNEKKIGSFVYLSCLLPELWSLKLKKWLIF